MKDIYISILIFGLMGFTFALLLAILSKKLKVEDDPQVEKILNALPGLNCGACGFNGCRPYAQSVVEKRELFSGCLPGGDDTNNQLSKILGISGNVVTHQKLIVCKCQAKSNEKKSSNTYFGPLTCKSAHLTGGPIDCSYGCLALGDCIKICPTNALEIKDNRIEVNNQKCINCGKCITICPRNLFELVPSKKDKMTHYIACNNKDNALSVKKVCLTGCIGCGICAKIPETPYFLKENLSYIDYTKVSSDEPLENGMNKCPTKCILKINV